MARGRKSGPTRLDLRREADAVEAREKEVGEVAEEEASDDDESDDDDDAPKAKPKKKVEPKVAKAPVKRTRTPKEVRMKALWVVFDNGGKRVKEFPYPQKAAAEALLAEKAEEKKGSFYLQLVKEPLDA